jgi:hypothetical protein
MSETRKKIEDEVCVGKESGLWIKMRKLIRGRGEILNATHCHAEFKGRIWKSLIRFQIFMTHQQKRRHQCEHGNEF